MKFRAARLGAIGSVMAAGLAASISMAQTAEEPVSRAVVQPLPNQWTGELSSALRRLSASPRDTSALLQAGRASLKLNDLEAAAGFFTRADQAGGTRGEAKAGLAMAQVYNKRPVEALQLFAQAEQEGASINPLLGDLGLAYDLVGDNARAQEYYRKALAAGADPEITRRLALSQAIAGDRNASETTLLPLLQRQDLAAYRTRAFALAVLGKPEEAVAIADAVMPAALASRIAPYLRYMPRLTRAQQAAAGNFGHFPEASSIGRDDARIAEYANLAQPRLAVAPSADSRLVPAGEPLGTVKQATASARPAVAQPATPVPAPAVAVRGPAAPVPTQQRTEARVEAPAPVPVSAPVSTPVAPSAAVAVSGQAVPAVGGDFNLGDLSGSRRIETLPARPVAQPAAASADVAGVAPVPASAPAPAPAPAGLAQAFADFSLPQAPAKPAPGAVDITSIKPPREVEAKVEPAPKVEPKVAAKPAPKPAKPVHPSRFWVQVATGRDRAALAFDWRRMIRNSEKILKGNKAHVAKWGQTNRLLTGPFANQREATAFVAELKKAGIDSFTFTSAEGEQVDALPGA